MPTGKVKWYDTEKGFGFLSRDDGGDVFVHESALPEGVPALKPGSRVEFGIEITPARLARVDRAEAGVRAALEAAGIVVENVRVRDLGERARVEVDASRVAAVTGSEEVAEAVRTAGFASVEVDPRGFRSGAMNELLPQPERYRSAPG